MPVFGLQNKVLVVGGYRDVRSLLVCLTESVPSGSEMDTPLAQSEPISDGGSASGTTE